MKFGLKDEILDQINKEIHKIENIDRALIFGSRATGNFKEGSDIDIAILGDNLNIDHILKLQDLIDDLDIPYFTDVVIQNRINNQKLLEHIDKFGIVFFERKKAIF